MSRGLITGGIPAYRDARKELGLGNPPDSFGTMADQFFADQCDPRSKITIVEVARGRVDVGVPDNTINTTFGDRVDVFGKPDGSPPPGFTSLTNTLATPGLPPTDMIIRGLSIRILVEPETRTIPGNLLTVGDDATSVPGSPDAMTQNDILNALGLGTGQVLLPADLLWGLPTWKAAYAFMNGYELAWLRTHQDRMLQEPLTQTATIEPFAEADAAGLAFTTNQDRILSVNQRLVQLGLGRQQFMPIGFRRLGSLTVPEGAGTGNAGDFTASREDDASPTIFGGIGVPTNKLTKDPFLFMQPMFWPAGSSMSIQFIANDPFYQADFQRWISVTGGTGGNAGTDLSGMPWAATPAISGLPLSPSAPGVNTMLEQTLDPVTPINVAQQVPLFRGLVKGGAMVFEVGLIGMRVGQAWKQCVGRAIAAGALTCPMGYGTMPVPAGTTSGSFA